MLQLVLQNVRFWQFLDNFCNFDFKNGLISYIIAHAKFYPFLRRFFNLALSNTIQHKIKDMYRNVPKLPKCTHSSLVLVKKTAFISNGIMRLKLCWLLTLINRTWYPAVQGIPVFFNFKVQYCNVIRQWPSLLKVKASLVNIIVICLFIWFI